MRRARVAVCLSLLLSCAARAQAPLAAAELPTLTPCEVFPQAPSGPLTIGARAGDRAACAHLGAWARWTNAGTFALVSRLIPSIDSAMAVVDLPFLLMRGQMSQVAAVTLDSVVAARTAVERAAGDSLLHLTMFSLQSTAFGEHQFVSWIVATRRTATGRQRFSPPLRIRRRDTLMSDGTVILQIGEDMPPSATAGVRAQLDSLREWRRAFGRTQPLPPLTILAGPPGDTALAMLGIVRTSTPYHAFLTERPLTLISPVNGRGGVSRHELAHLIHYGTNDRLLDPNLTEAFASAIGGSFGRAMPTEVCGAAARLQLRALVADPPPIDSLRLRNGGYETVRKLLTIAIGTTLATLPDSSTFFAPGRWRRGADQWSELARFTGRDRDGLVSAATDTMRAWLERCPAVAGTSPH